MKENLIKIKTYQFAVRIVKLNKFLVNEQKEYVLSKQILKSGTSIGANTEEADAGQSKKDFISKFSIALKEAKETHYWLRLLFDCEYITKQMYDSLILDCEEIIFIITKILQTSRTNLKNDTN
jgi:four helix bundle protein